MPIAWDLASGWETRRLGDVAPESSVQVTPSDFPDDTFNYWGLDAIDKGEFEEPAPNLVRGNQVSSTCVRFNHSHVLYGKLRPYLNKVIVPTVEGVGSTEWVSLQPHLSKLDRHFLAYILRTSKFVHYAETNSTGARMPRVRKEAIRDVEIPIPYPNEPERSLAEQRRIVARIEALLAEVREMRVLTEAMEKDAQALFDAYSREVFKEVNAKYSREKLKSLSTKIGSGSTPRGGKAVYKESGIPFIRSLNVRWNEFSEKELVFIDDDIHQRMSSTTVLPGDVLLNITGASIGRSCCVPYNICPANVNQHVSIIRANEKLSPQFLMYWLTSPSTQFFINENQTGATRQALTKSQIEDFNVPLPGKIEQASIIEYLNKVRSEVKEILASSQSDEILLKQLEQGILEQAFRGEL